MKERSGHRRMFSVLVVGLAVGVPAANLVNIARDTDAVVPVRLVSGPAPNAVAKWAAVVGPAIHNAKEPRSPASAFVQHTVVQLAVYDAVMAIDGGYEPFHTRFDGGSDADLDAAVATAAYRSARGRVSESQFAYLDERYAEFMAGISDGPAKQEGVEIGETAAAGMLRLRSNDGFGAQVSYQCSADPPPAGEFEPDAGCGTQPIDPHIARLRPFTFDDAARFRPGPPGALTSEAWAKDFDEVKAYGAAGSTVRTAEQTDVAYFWSEHAYVHWNRNLLRLAGERGLDVPQTARLLAMTYTAVTDAAVAGLEAKYAFRLWRPRTAIPRAGEDDNLATSADAGWVPLLSVNHPEYPSGHGFVSSALVMAVEAALGTDQIEWTIETSKEAVPQLVRATRTYTELGAIPAELDDARVWAGLHFRTSMAVGRSLGREVAEHVLTHHFGPTRR